MKTAFATLPFTIRLSLSLIFAGTILGCQSGGSANPGRSRADLERQLSESQTSLHRYETRYGKLLPERPRHEFRKLRAQLKGKRMSTVTAILGKPASVYTSGTTESWDYTNIAYDSASGRTVRRLEIWFEHGVADRVQANF